MLAHLPEDERNPDQLNWFDPKSATIKTYVRQTKKCIISIQKGTDEEKNKEEDDDVDPDYNISEVSARLCKKKGKHGSVNGRTSVASSTSSTGSARLREEAEHAALLAKTDL